MENRLSLQEQVQQARDRARRAGAHTGGGLHLVGYDVNGIQEYIGANSRPIAMRGASLLIKDFDRRQREAGALFADGGRGMFLVSEAKAAELVEDLPRRYARESVTGVLAAASAPWSPRDERASLQWLKLRLTVAKESALPPNDERPHSKESQCGRCRAYKATAEISVGEADRRVIERVCARCERITELGRIDAAKSGQRALSLSDLSSNGYVAAISADGNAMGQLFDALDTLESVAATSAAVGWIFEDAHEQALEATGAERREYVAPIAGGDDIRVFLAPKYVEPYIRTLVEKVHDGAGKLGNLWGALKGEPVRLAKQVGVGVGVAVAGDSTSASWMLQRAHHLERSAKMRCLKGAQSAVDFVWISAGEVYLEGVSTGPERRGDRRPLPLDRGFEDYVAYVKELRIVPAAQRAIVAQRRSMGAAEFENLFRYQVARTDAWQAWYKYRKSEWRDPKRIIDDMPDASMIDMLRIVGDR